MHSVQCPDYKLHATGIYKSSQLKKLSKFSALVEISLSATMRNKEKMKLHPQSSNQGLLVCLQYFYK